MGCGPHRSRLPEEVAAFDSPPLLDPRRSQQVRPNPCASGAPCAILCGGERMARKYDVIIVGAGPAGIFAALELSEVGNLKILLLEKGKDLDKRRCPASDRTSN